MVTIFVTLLAAQNVLCGDEAQDQVQHASNRKFLDVMGLLPTRHMTATQLLEMCPFLSPERVSPMIDDTLTIALHFEGYRFNGIDDVKEEFSMIGELEVIWEIHDTCNGTFLNITSETGIKFFVEPINTLWRPNLLFVNSKKTLLKNSGLSEIMSVIVVTPEHKDDKKALFHFKWSLSGEFVFNCPLNLQRFPADIQRCEGTMRTFDQMLLTNITQIVFHVDPENFMSDNFEFQLLHRFRRLSLGPYASAMASFGIVVQRQHGFYLRHIAMPCVILAVLEMAGFGLPPKEPERATFTMTIFLAFSFMESQLVDAIPKTPKRLILADYIAFQSTFSMLVTLYAAAMTYYTKHFRGSKRKQDFVPAKTEWPWRVFNDWERYRIIDLFAFVAFLLIGIVGTAYHLSKIFLVDDVEAVMDNLRTYVVDY